MNSDEWMDRTTRNRCIKNISGARQIYVRVRDDEKVEDNELEQTGISKASDDNSIGEISFFCISWKKV